jgi:hypothetical protein
MSYETKLILKLLKIVVKAPKFNRFILNSLIRVIESGEHLYREQKVINRFSKGQDNLEATV